MDSVLKLLVTCFTGERAPRKQKVIIINGLHYCTSLLLLHQFAGIMRTASVSVCGFCEGGHNVKVKEAMVSRSRQQ